MSEFWVEGPATVSGRVPIEGAKNAALPCIVAALLTTEPVHLVRVPDVIDVHNLRALLAALGVEIAADDRGLRLQATRITSSQPPDAFVRRLRASFLVLGPLAARTGTAVVAYPGGCAIGRRPVDQHLLGLTRMGFDVQVQDQHVLVTAGPPRACTFRFARPSVTGTEHLLMTAALRPVTTVLENCAREPEVVQLAELLVRMGATIEGIGTKRLVVRGRSELGGAQIHIIPDRIEAGTYILAAAATRGRIQIDSCDLDHLSMLVERLSAMGVVFSVSPSRVVVDAREMDLPPGESLRTEPYPGFPTDLQAQYMVLMTQMPGPSQVEETVFPERFRHVQEFNRMGAHIRVDPPHAYIHGPTPLHGTEVEASDLRASASLVIAALTARGMTRIREIHHLDRGYARMDAKLRQLGVNVQRSPAPVPTSALR